MAGKNPHFARTNAIKAKNRRKSDLADPRNLHPAMRELATRITLTIGALTKANMSGRPDSEEFSVVRPAVRATIAETLLEELGQWLPELLMAESASKERVALSKSYASHAKNWRGMLTLAHVEKYGDRACKHCSMRLLPGEEVYVEDGSTEAAHWNCVPKTGKGEVRVFAIAQRHLNKGAATCELCRKEFELGQPAAWRIGWKTMSHESCWKAAGQPSNLT